MQFPKHLVVFNHNDANHFVLSLVAGFIKRGRVTLADIQSAPLASSLSLSAFDGNDQSADTSIRQNPDCFTKRLPDEEQGAYKNGEFDMSGIGVIDTVQKFGGTSPVMPSAFPHAASVAGVDVQKGGTSPAASLPLPSASISLSGADAEVADATFPKSAIVELDLYSSPIPNGASSSNQSGARTTTDRLSRQLDRDLRLNYLLLMLAQHQNGIKPAKAMPIRN